MSDYLHESAVAKMISNNNYQQGYSIGFANGYQQGKTACTEEVIKNIELGIEATGHHDQYTTGFCNALIWLKSCITNEEEPIFLQQLEEENK